MAFKPSSQGKANASGPREDTSKYPVPRTGSRKARVSLIVDLGVQEREDFEDPVTKELKPQKPCQQVAVFADLVADVVDYGGHIGKAQYRLLLNKSFMGDVQGVNFTTTPPKDAKGNTIEGKPWGLHPLNLLAKLAKAVCKPQIISEGTDESLDISLLLNEPFMAQVEVKETEGKKLDGEGNPVVYKNVNFRGPSEVAEDDDGEKIAVAALTAKPLCVTFDNAKKSDIQFIRAVLLAKIKLALNYEGSKMQAAIVAFEAEKGESPGAEEAEEQEDDAPPPPKKTAAPKKPATPKKPTPPVGDDDDDDSIPF